MGETTIRDPAALPIACSLGAGDLASRGEWLRRDLCAAAEERREPPDGGAYRFPGTDASRDKLLAFAAAERTCCPFFRIEVAFEPGRGPIWLTLRGPEGIKDVIRQTFDGGAGVSEQNKEIVRRLVDEVLNAGRMDAVDELFAPALAPSAKRWIAPFRASFPDMRMDIVDLIAEGDAVVGRFTCSGTHTGDWRGHAPSGRRFEAVDEVSIFRLRERRIVDAWGIEDTLGRLEQLGLR